jgi:RHS repeat-associated protein
VRKDVSGQPSTEYYYFGNEIVAEQNISTSAWTNYVFFGGDRIARREYPSGDVSYYFSDHLKTASVITDAAGTIKAESDYYPWGGELQFVNNDTNHYKFTGKERDAESGLDYFGARYYSNGLGRWVSADWSATPVPVPYANFNNPQSLNLYGYVGANPATKADLDGHYAMIGHEEACNGQRMCQQKSDDKGGIADWLGSQLPNPKSGNSNETSREVGPSGVDQNALMADSLNKIGGGLQFVGETAAFIDPSGIVAAGGAMAKGKDGEAILFIGLALLPGGKKAEEAIHVYQIVKDGKVIYVGITNNLWRRGIEHGADLDHIVTMGSRLDARAVEQALIQHHGLQKNGGALVNKTNSVSPRNPKFSDYVKYGFEVLRSMNYIF